MFEKILVPLDGSLLAECVLPHTVAIATAFNAELVLLHVVESANTSIIMPADPLAWQMRKAEAKAYLENVRWRLHGAGIRVSGILLEGMAAHRIADYAHSKNCDLLILSSHGSGGLEPWSAGSVAQKVMQYAKTSLLLIRAFQEQERNAIGTCYRRIMLPLDGSQRAESALPTAITLAQHWDAELLLVHMVARPLPFRKAHATAKSAGMINKFVERNLTEAREYLDQLQSRLPLRSQVRLSVADDVMVALHEVAAQESVDLVLASAHGHGGNAQRRFGSLMAECIVHGASPLLVFQDMRPEQIVATAVECSVRENDDSGRWQPPQPVSRRLV